MQVYPYEKFRSQSDELRQRTNMLVILDLASPEHGTPIAQREPWTLSSSRRGIRNFAEGCYAAIRNPLSHTEGELPEDQALEQLAALSVLARWVDTATLDK